jgi:hypothetical protein
MTAELTDNPSEPKMKVEVRNRTLPGVAAGD